MFIEGMMFMKILMLFQQVFSSSMACLFQKMVGSISIFTLIFMLFSINFYIFLLGWVLTSIYCYKAQLNLLFSFSMLEGKAFSLKVAAKEY